MDKNWFTRFEQDRVDAQYLANMTTATQYFMAWFPFATTSGFNDMLMNMHKIASAGGYTGYTNGGPYIATTGQFRGVNKDSWRPLLKKEWFSGNFMIEGGKIYPKVAARKLQGCHHLVVRPNGYELHIPHEDHVPAFLGCMADMMIVLRDGFFPDLLAYYIQYFVVGHPFERINFSICMAQVNAILWHYGFEPMRHGWFDFDCFVYDYGRVERKFNESLRRQ